MNILVIGGQGFVGQYLVREIIKDPEHNVTIVSRNHNTDQHVTTKNNNNNNNNRVKKFTGVDILNYVDVLKYFKDQDVVFNLAGFISFKQKDRLMLNDINHFGALNVLNACEKMNVKKLIHMSSTAALGFSNSEINESHTFDWSKAKKCVYSISKSLANNDIKSSKCNTIIVYPSLVIGPGDKTNTLKLIRAIEQKKIPFNSLGSNSIVDVRDLARALSFLMKSKSTHKEYIISQGSYSFKEINHKIANVLNVNPPKFTAPKEMLYPLLFLINLIEIFSKNPPITYENVYLSFKDRKHNNERLKSIGFKFRYSLDKTIEDSIKWSKGINEEK